MTWTHALAGEIANEFREAQRRSRGIVPPTEEEATDIVHRDTKPDNVILKPNRRRIVDTRGDPTP